MAKLRKFRLTWRLLWAIVFALVMGASGRPRKLTFFDECVSSAPRSLDKALTTALCEGARSYTAAAAAAECAHAVGRAALNPRLAVSLCGAGPDYHAAGVAGGQCARAAQRRLTSLDQLPPTLRHDLCVGARGSRSVGSSGGRDSKSAGDGSAWAEAPVVCALAAGRIGRAANARGRKLDWLANAEHRVLLCQGAYGGSAENSSSMQSSSSGSMTVTTLGSTATAPVACAEALASGASQGVGPGPGQVSVAMAVALCAQATSAAPGQCGAAASGLLGTNRAIMALNKASSSSDFEEHFSELVEETDDEGHGNSEDPSRLLAALCRSASRAAPVAPAQCLLHQSISSWPLAARVALCARTGHGLEALERNPTTVANLAENHTSNSMSEATASNGVNSERLAELALAAAEGPGQCVAGVKRVGGFSDAWTDTQLLALCRAAPPAAEEEKTRTSPDGVYRDGSNKGDDMTRHFETTASLRWLAQHKAPVAAAQCANAAPPQMTPDEKVALCASAPATDDAPFWTSMMSGGRPTSRTMQTFSADTAQAVDGFGGSKRGTASSSSSPGTSAGAASAAAACAHKAGRFLRDGSAKAALCAGARDLGPAECAAAAPFTMDPRLKVALCSGAPAGGAPGRCAAVVRAASAESALTTYRDESSSSSKGKDGIDGSSDELATVPLPPSAAAAAGMDGGAPADYWWADWIAISLCRGAASDAPSQCFARAPPALDAQAVAAVRAGAGSAFAHRQEHRQPSPGSARKTILAWAQPEFAAPPHSLRASLCADAEDNGPAECARVAFNYTAATNEGSISSTNGKRVLAPGTVVSLCHSATLEPGSPSNDNTSRSSRTKGSPFTNEHSLASFGPLACAVAAASAPLARSLGLDLPVSSASQVLAAGASAAPAPPLQLLRLCSGARSRGPADCAAAAPTRLSADEKVDLCRTVSDNQDHNEDRNSCVILEDDATAALWPALCAAAAPDEVPSHKVVTTCQGASSVTPAHCLRAAPGSLTSADLLRCRTARPEATAVHVSVSEALGGRHTRAPSSFSAEESSSLATTGALARGETQSQLEANGDAGSQNSEPTRAENSGFDDKSLPSSTVAVEAVVVDQFHQPLQAAVNLVHTQEGDNSNSLGDRRNSDAVSNSNGGQGGGAAKSEGNISTAEVAVGPGAPLAADGRSRFTSLQFAFQRANDMNGDKTPALAQEGNKSHKGKSSSRNAENDTSDVSSRVSSGVESFSALLRLVLGGETLSHVHLSATTPTPNSPPGGTPTGYGTTSLLRSTEVFREAAFVAARDLTMAATAVAADTLSGVALGLQHDWTYTSSSSGMGKWSQNLVQEGEVQQNGDRGHKDAMHGKGSMAHLVGEVAGAAAVLPFRAGQGVGAHLRLQLHHARGSSSRQTPTPPDQEGLASSSSEEESDAASEGSSQSNEGERDTSEKAETDHKEHHNRRTKGGGTAREDGRGEQAFDNVVGAVFVVLALGVSARTVAFVWRTANCGGRSQFGVGDFGSDFYDASRDSSSSGGSKAVGLGGATRAERNARAEELRLRQASARLAAARQHDAALGLVAPGAALGDGLAKRRKKFVLGVK